MTDHRISSATASMMLLVAFGFDVIQGTIGLFGGLLGMLPFVGFVPLVFAEFISAIIGFYAYAILILWFSQHEVYLLKGDGLKITGLTSLIELIAGALLPAITLMVFMNIRKSRVEDRLNEGV